MEVEVEVPSVFPQRTMRSYNCRQAMYSLQFLTEPHLFCNYTYTY